MALYEQKQKEEQKNNPMSVHYERVNIRPKLNFLRVLPLMLVTLLVSVIIALAFYFTINSLIVSFLSGSIFLLIMVLVHIKYVVIWLVKVYQRFAPEKVRNKCRYEPSCSNYMILAIEKYGFWKGFTKGFVRWTHCKPPYGGHDEP